jgi:hypothetical protein
MVCCCEILGDLRWERQEWKIDVSRCWKNRGGGGYGSGRKAILGFFSHRELKIKKFFRSGG